MNTVVIYGRDPRLLETRQWLLETEGYHVLTITDIAQIESIPPPVDLLILCHTGPSDECARVLDLALARWPGVRELVLVARGATTACIHESESFYTVEGPAKLISLVHHLLPSNRPQAAWASNA